ncbi:hypothetical protein XELAEV_18016581mg [Xenopus laevis]|uniref:Uncharacterized protein n=1 Tax=Xenopus laevis TaxID=8355 RepID=A0A974DA04_XENLA|nr:hypothetical protein XELAEV_18016581mg [Xenopus laevis]
MRQLDRPCRHPTYSIVHLRCPCPCCDHTLAQTQHLPLAPALAHLHSSWCHLSDTHIHLLYTPRQQSVKTWKFFPV